ncbi:MAG: coiled coil domain-containing protein [Gammaproteobacteria bacterium]|nr:coiled coil domain-containing protein [Gammaproteobacteria bacterium]
MSLRETYESKIQAQLNDLKLEIADLRTKADKLEANLQLEYYTRIDELHLKFEIANQRFEQLKQTSDEKWEEIKIEFEIIWDTLRELIKSATSP